MRPVARSNQSDPAAERRRGADPGRRVPQHGIEDADGLRRIDRACELWRPGILPALSGRFRTEVLAFGAGLTPPHAATLTASAPRSDLTSALAEVSERYRGRTVAGIVLLSDGGDTSQADGVARGGSCAGVSRSASARRPSARTAKCSASPRPKRCWTIRVSISPCRRSATATAPRRSSCACSRTAGRRGPPRHARRRRHPGPRSLSRAPRTATRPTVYTIEIPAAAGELVPENNSRSVLVPPPSPAAAHPARPGRARLRAQLPAARLERRSRARSGLRRAQGQERTGRRHVLHAGGAGARSASLAAGYPTRARRCFAYDAVVLANVEGSSLTRRQLEATRDFVGERGGGLLVLGAQSFLRQGLLDTPLEDVLPLDLVRSRPRRRCRPRPRRRGEPIASRSPPPAQTTRSCSSPPMPRRRGNAGTPCPRSRRFRRSAVRGPARACSR